MCTLWEISTELYLHIVHLGFRKENNCDITQFLWYEYLPPYMQKRMLFSPFERFYGFNRHLVTGQAIQRKDDRQEGKL
jgi:hypothetical protein